MSMDKTLKELLVALRNMPQCYTFSDVPPKVDSDFRGEIDRLIKQLESPSLE